jgi:phosphoglycerate dehydrogenase-like enzyme
MSAGKEMNQPVEVLITVPFEEEQMNTLRGVSPRLKLTVVKARKPEDVPDEVWKKTEVLYTDGVLPDEGQAPNLRWVQFHWAGIDHAADHPLLENPEISTTTLSGAAASKIAEYALMMLLSLGHRLPAMVEAQRKAEWPNDRWERFCPKELSDSTVGIVGYGSIGRQIAKLLYSFGATVLATKRNPMRPQDSGYMPEGQGDPEGDLVYRLYPSEALKSMFKECDFVVVTVPLTRENEKLIGANELTALKPSAYLVDVSRGGVIDPDALLSALKDKRIAGAALDVHHEEPLPSDNPFWKLPNVIITPHISGFTPYYNDRATALFSENLHRYLAEMPLYNRYDPEKGY